MSNSQASQMAPQVLPKSQAEEERVALAAVAEETAPEEERGRTRHCRACLAAMRHALELVQDAQEDWLAYSVLL
ncbi:hypothetical protein LTR08_007736 [Meristemomyces frigidus]|nr:hypothetical protein LTR08_007736 [Meristemomyces frigidus]